MPRSHAAIPEVHFQLLHWSRKGYLRSGVRACCNLHMSYKLPQTSCFPQITRTKPYAACYKIGHLPSTTRHDGLHSPCHLVSSIKPVEWHHPLRRSLKRALSSLSRAARTRKRGTAPTATLPETGSLRSKTQSATAWPTTSPPTQIRTNLGILPG